MAKLTVEECLILDINELVRPGDGCPAFFGYAPVRQGTESVGSVSYLLNTDSLEVFWCIGTNRSHLFSLVRTPARLGGERVWFSCPGCGRPVSKLYLPPSEERFLCRGCHDLSYDSCQKRVPPLIQAMILLEELREKEETSLADQGRSRRAARRAHRLFAILDKLDFAGEPRDPAPAGPWPKRPRGRPKEKRTYERHKPVVVSTPPSEGAAYCVKCRDRRELEEPRLVTLANGRPALQGTCPVCHTRVARIVKATEMGHLKKALCRWSAS